MPMCQCIGVMIKRPTDVCIDEITTVQVSGRSTRGYVSRTYNCNSLSLIPYSSHYSHIRRSRGKSHLVIYSVSEPDDHMYEQIINNYAGQSNDSQPPFPNADNAYELYNAQANYDSPAEGQHYYEFRYGDVAFFVMDTRRYRSDILTEDLASRTMLGDLQLAALYDWLGRV